MRVSKEHKEKIRAEILEAAGQGFREEGYGGLGIDGLARRAGLTSGAFYGHFSSKDEAFKEAVVKGLADYAGGVKEFETKHGADWPEKFIDYYLGEDHRKDLACSCAVPGLSAEVMRAGDEVKKAYEKELIKIADNIAAGFKDENRDKAWAFMALLTGAVLMARSASSEKTAEDITAAARKWTEEMVSA